MLVKLQCLIEVEDDYFDEMKRLEHHIEYLMDLDNHPEIESVSDVKITRKEELR